MTTTRVARSLTDRVLGGVCGGLSACLGLNPWWARAMVALLTVLSAGVAGLLYLILWWTLPPDLTPDEPGAGRGPGALLLVGAAIVITGLIVIGRGMNILSGPSGGDLFWPVVLLITGAALLLMTLRRA